MATILISTFWCNVSISWYFNKNLYFSEASEFYGTFCYDSQTLREAKNAMQNMRESGCLSKLRLRWNTCLHLNTKFLVFVLNHWCNWTFVFVFDWFIRCVDDLSLISHSWVLTANLKNKLIYIIRNLFISLFILGWINFSITDMNCLICLYQLQ